MKITNEEISRALPAIGILRKLKLPVKLAFKLGTMLATLRPIAKNLDEVRFDIIKKYGKKDDKGKLIAETGEDGGQGYDVTEHQAEVDTEMQELMKIVNEVAITPLKIDEFPETVEVEVSVFQDTGFLIK